MPDYSDWTYEDLLVEHDNWTDIVDADRKPGCPSRGEREAAQRMADLVGCWLIRKRKTS